MVACYSTFVCDSQCADTKLSTVWMAVYFKLFDMIGIQTILVEMLLTDGKAIRGERDGAAHLFYGPLSLCLIKY